MMTLLLSLLTKFRVGMAELLGVTLLTVAAGQYDHRAALVVLGVAVLLKSLDWDMKPKPPADGARG